MYYNAVEVKYISGYKLKITFENGKEGIIDFQDYVKSGGVFSRFSSIAYFKQAYINKELGVLCWPDGVDIAPETLYSEVTGEPLPAWMIGKTNRRQKAMLKK